MPGPQPTSIVKVTSKERKVLKRMRRRHQIAQCLVWRIQIILLAAKGYSNSKISRRVGKDRHAVRLWRARWVEATPVLEAAREKGMSKRERTKLLEIVLSDAYRCGAPGKFTAEQLAKVIAVACEPPEQSDRPITHWTARELADEVVKRHIVDSISVRTVGRLLSDADLKPHQSRYWLNANPEDPAVFDAQVRIVCSLYLQARILHAAGVHLMSTDEKTGIQALERKAPTLPMRPGLVERREFEYLRHGTRCLIVNFEVATGRIVAPTVGPTRTEVDFGAHIAQTVATDPCGEWVFIVDQLNTHQSETLVRWIAAQCAIEMDLGVKGQSGVLKSMKTRKAFLQDASHRIRFVYTPKHTSWLNQVEIWFSILVRRLLKRASFTSVEELHQRLLDFIAYFNQTMAKPFKWTFTGKPLAA
jgi:transposase